MSNVNNAVETKVTARMVAVATFNAALPFKAEIGNRAFRGMVLAQLRTMYKHNSVPVMYNFAINNAMKSAMAIATGQEDVTLLEGMTWMVINKKTKAPVAYAANRKQAYVLRDGDNELSCKAIK